MAYSNKTRYRTELSCLLNFIGGMPSKKEDLKLSIKPDSLKNPEKTIPQILRRVDEAGNWDAMKKIGKAFQEDYPYSPQQGKVHWSQGDNQSNQNVDIEFIDDDTIAGLSIKNSVDSPNLKNLGKKHIKSNKFEDVFGLSPHYRDLYRHAVDKLFDQGYFKSKDGPYEAEVIQTRSGEKILITTGKGRREKTFTRDKLKNWPSSPWRKVVGRFAKEFLDGTDDMFESIARELGKDLCEKLRPRVEELIRKNDTLLIGCIEDPYHFYCVKGRELFLVPSKNDDRWNQLSIKINNESERFGSGIRFRCDVSVGDSTGGTTLDIWLRSNTGLFTNCMVDAQKLKHKERLWERIN